MHELPELQEFEEQQLVLCMADVHAADDALPDTAHSIVLAQHSVLDTVVGHARTCMHQRRDSCDGSQAAGSLCAHLSGSRGASGSATANAILAALAAIDCGRPL
eukprot:jgi/Ulvmu1/10671/UM066_0055.1